MIRTFKQNDTDPRLKALRLPIVGDEFKVLDLLIAQKQCITTVRALKAICLVRNKDFAEPVAYQPRAKPTRKTRSISQITARKAG